MIETVHIRLSEAKKTTLAGKSLCQTLYTSPLDILLSGELGAGKTTFMQGFAEGLGIEQHITSPTYALEQRYMSKNRGECLHIDLYRLNQSGADELVQHTNEHTGIRCIEWPERLTHEPENPLRIHLEDKKDAGRDLTVTFEDIPLPSKEEILQWREELCLPKHIAKHCDAVAAMCLQLAESLIENGVIIRKEALYRGALVHDLLRFVDFRAKVQPGMEETEEQIACWKPWREQYKDMRHEHAVAGFLRERGFDILATIVEPHGLTLPSPDRSTIEQKVLFYADKRVKFDEVVTLQERFNDFNARYADGKETEESKIWFKEATEVERELEAMGAKL